MPVTPSKENHRNLSLVVFLFISSLLLTSCSWLPGTQGPRLKASKVKRGDFKLVIINERFIKANAKRFQHVGKTQGAFQKPNTSKHNFNYRIAHKDILSITVWDHPELTIKNEGKASPEASGYVVDGKGEFFFPYVGLVKAAGRTTNEIRSELTRRLKGSVVDPQVGVNIISYRGKEAYVTGAVSNPGAYSITDIPLTITRALSNAGGLTPDADQRHAIINKNGTPNKVDLKALYQGRGRHANYILKNGDILYVPKNNNDKVFVMGEINKPQTLAFGYSGLSLAEALSNSNGLNQVTSNSRGVFVVRHKKNDSKPTVYQLSLASVHKWALAERFPLHSRDIVYVTASDSARWSRLINQILPFAALANSSIDTKNSF